MRARHSWPQFVLPEISRTLRVTAADMPTTAIPPITATVPTTVNNQRINNLAGTLERPVNHTKHLKSWPFSSLERLGNDICLQRLPDLHPACFLCRFKGTLIPAEHVCRGRSSLVEAAAAAGGGALRCVQGADIPHRAALTEFSSQHSYPVASRLSFMIRSPSDLNPP